MKHVPGLMAAIFTAFLCGSSLNVCEAGFLDNLKDKAGSMIKDGPEGLAKKAEVGVKTRMCEEVCSKFHIPKVISSKVCSILAKKL